MKPRKLPFLETHKTKAKQDRTSRRFRPAALLHAQFPEGSCEIAPLVIKYCLVQKSRSRPVIHSRRNERIKTLLKALCYSVVAAIAADAAAADGGK